MRTVLEVKNISKSYGNQLVVNNFSLSLQKGMIGCLLGPSGCGKTTILRIIAGFEDINAGEIRINQAIVSGRHILVPPEQRRVGMVFQDYALFPHLSVKDNVAFGLRNINGKKKEKRIDELLHLVRLVDAAPKFPHEISGGQQQRVALARALAPEPELLLLDEPFSNLDVALRERLSTEVREILKEQATTALMVTHNQHEAFAVSDEIGVIQDGKLVQWDSGHNLYHRPANDWVADFVGDGVLLPGMVLDDRSVATGLGILEGQFKYPCQNGCPADVLIRPEDIIHDDASDFKAKILKKHFRGANILYTLQLPSKDVVLALVPSTCQHDVGHSIGIIPKVNDIILFEK
ncbi:MAG: ABC transporter ATP-binding protein [Desulfobacterales bacterium]|jgi:iron(III) transport system ATP-binding protein